MTKNGKCSRNERLYLKWLQLTDSILTDWENRLKYGFPNTETLINLNQHLTKNNRLLILKNLDLKPIHHHNVEL